VKISMLYVCSSVSTVTTLDDLG